MKSRPIDALIAGIASFRSLAHQWDPLADRVLLIDLAPDEARKASFLDQRLLQPGTLGAWTDWAAFEAAAARLPDRAPGLIFHVGHCGSTLVSRLLEAATGAPALREPLILRSIASEHGDAASGDGRFGAGALNARLAVFLRSLARADGTAIVKASSFCGALAAPVLERFGEARAAFMVVKPEIHVATMLGGENNYADLFSFAKMRRRSLMRSGTDVAPLDQLSIGEIAAMSWLAEVAARASAVAGARYINVDFDDFLRSPHSELSRLCRHFGAPANDRSIDAALSGPIMTSYSKAPEHAFDAAFRARVLADYRAAFADEIRKAMAFLEAAARCSPVAATALGQFR